MTPPQDPRVAARVDGRDARWTEHREQRRRELTDAALRAIRKHGATVGMDEIAAEAGTSKTVIYRHFGDRLGLYLAVCASVDSNVLGDLQQALTHAGDGSGTTALAGDSRAVVEAVIDSYFVQVERDPEVYRFVVRRPALNVSPEDDPVIGISDTIADVLQPIFAEALRTAGRPTSAARIWAHGLIGFVRESADRWLADPDRPPRPVVVRHMADFATYGLTGALGLDKNSPR
ncbi:MAG TPA: TetR/AcrR family transcriptional regulator [Flexivirga sp.]|uniref:TetR/AcrR family transcriptional regulator n=1 Tax=Flexivirga sp. TaxID=1962927 RepID=UPI002D1A1454|nr:TetR/AcrR family transcriptional regulator [Flexivirga sp.]HWC23652.1 TetR/AcrR family transcriptional regulator [Flexivirga sp.]